MWPATFWVIWFIFFLSACLFLPNSPVRVCALSEDKCNDNLLVEYDWLRLRIWCLTSTHELAVVPPFATKYKSNRKNFFLHPRNNLPQIVTTVKRPGWKRSSVATIVYLCRSKHITLFLWRQARSAASGWSVPSYIWKKIARVQEGSPRGNHCGTASLRLVEGAAKVSCSEIGKEATCTRHSW